ncbi:MAG: hypothetical protein WCS87_19160 [Methylococcaceae bacterium]
MSKFNLCWKKKQGKSNVFVIYAAHFVMGDFLVMFSCDSKAYLAEQAIVWERKTIGLGLNK